MIDRSFQLGRCHIFREDNLTKMMREESMYSMQPQLGLNSGTAMDRTLLVFDGCNKVLGCTICLSGPVATESEELQRVK